MQCECRHGYITLVFFAGERQKPPFDLHLISLLSRKNYWDNIEISVVIFLVRGSSKWQTVRTFHIYIFIWNDDFCSRWKISMFGLCFMLISVFPLSPLCFHIQCIIHFEMTKNVNCQPFIHTYVNKHTRRSENSKMAIAFTKTGSFLKIECNQFCAYCCFPSFAVTLL